MIGVGTWVWVWMGTCTGFWIGIDVGIIAGVVDIKFWFDDCIYWCLVESLLLVFVIGAITGIVTVFVAVDTDDVEFTDCWVLRGIGLIIGAKIIGLDEVLNDPTDVDDAVLTVYIIFGLLVIRLVSVTNLGWSIIVIVFFY